MDTYGDQGFQVLNIQFQNNSGGTPTEDQIKGWADTYGMTDVAALAASQEDVALYEMDGYIPTTYILDRTMTVVSADEMIEDPSSWL